MMLFNVLSSLSGKLLREGSKLIRCPQRGVCIRKCGNKRHLPEVKAP